MVIVGMGHFSGFFVSRVLRWIFVVFEVPPRYAERDRSGVEDRI